MQNHYTFFFFLTLTAANPSSTGLWGGEEPGDDDTTVLLVAGCEVSSSPLLSGGLPLRKSGLVFGDEGVVSCLRSATIFICSCWARDKSDSTHRDVPWDTAGLVLGLFLAAAGLEEEDAKEGLGTEGAEVTFDQVAAGNFSFPH